MKLILRTVIFFLILFLQNTISAQTPTTKIVISGKVTDFKKESLIGASVSVSGFGTITDSNGDYNLPLSLNVGEYKIVVSYLGYTTLTQRINLVAGENKFDFTLEEANTLLQTTTVTAGKFDKPLSEITVSLEVLKPNLIENVNTRRLDDVLQKVPGVNIIDGQANIRGGSGWSYGAGSRVLLLVDDIPALQADAGFPNWKDIAVENLEQVEILKGAASALYGSSAMNGIINVRTGFAKSEPETKISTSYVGYLSPSDPAKKWWTSMPYESTTSVLHKQKFGDLDVVASIYYANQNYPWKDWYDKYGRFTLNVKYKITEKLSIGLNTNYNQGSSQYYLYWKDMGAGAYIGTASAYNKSNRTRFNIDPYLNYFDENGNRHKILSRFYSVDNSLENNQANKSQLYYVEYQFQKKFKNDLVLTTGLVHSNAAVSAQLYGDTTYTSQNNAAYLQLDKKWNKLNVSFGARYESNAVNGPLIVKYPDGSKDTSSTNGKLSEARPVFRLGLNYQVGNATFLRASIGQGYRFPTVAELYISTLAGSFPVIPNPTLTSETGYTAEIAVKQGIKSSHFQGFFDIALFYQQYNNMMEFLADSRIVPSFQSQNVGNTEIKGIELSFTGEYKINTDVKSQFLVGYTYIDPTYRDFTPKLKSNSSDTNNILKYRFRHNFKFDGALDINNFSFGAGVIYNSNMESIDKILEFLIPEVSPFRAAHTNGFLTLDLRTSYKINLTKLSLIVANATNAEYSYRPGILELPRNFQIRIDQTFKYKKRKI